MWAFLLPPSVLMLEVSKCKLKKSSQDLSFRAFRVTQQVGGKCPHKSHVAPQNGDVIHLKCRCRGMWCWEANVEELNGLVQGFSARYVA